MRLKTLLLGSAAAFAFAGGSAQAADLSVAEPVDYVRVCDAFGVGYWYIPGTDQCIAISGKVGFEVGWEENQTYKVENVNIVGNNIEYDEVGSDWYFKTSADFNVDVRSITDWGPLVAFVAFTSDSDNAQYFNPDPEDPNFATDRSVFLDEAFLSLGPLLLGYTGSVSNLGGGYTDFDFELLDADADQIQLSWAFNGFGVALGIEDPRDRWGSDESMDFPDLSGALEFGVAGLDLKLTALYGDTEGDSTWAVGGETEIELGIFQFGVGAVYAEGAGSGSVGYQSGDGWAAYLSSQQNWASNFYTAETIAYDDSIDQWGAAFMAAYSPVDTLWMSMNAGTNNEGDDWKVYFLAEKTFGPNG